MNAPDPLPSLDAVKRTVNADAKPIKAPAAIDLASLGTRIRELKDIVGLVFASLVSTAATFSVPPVWARYLAGAITLVLLIIAAVMLQQRFRSSHKDDPLDPDPSGAGVARDPSIRPAFRLLNRYCSGEQLPGKGRRALAAALLAKVRSPDFQICVVTGDSGAGKSSLVDCALSAPLQAGGTTVVRLDRYSLSALDPGTAHATAGITPSGRIWDLINEHVQKAAVPAGAPILLILDQFEEVLLRISDVAGRQSLGVHLRTALASGWKIVIGIRKEFFTELQEIARALGIRIALTEDVFHVRNFDVVEAAGVIMECAVHDEINCSSGLAQRIANDLASNGEVRPPDLQIVCDSLRREMTVDRYLERGGATGLRAAFLADTMAIAGPPILTRTILRLLCDIPNGKKAADPLALDGLVKAASAGAPGQVATQETVQAVLNNLEDAYILIRLGSPQRPLWSLIHDYFVEPIKLATEDTETRRETALAELDFYRLEAKKTSGTVIPLARLREIRCELPTQALSDPEVRKLIARSWIVGYGKPLALNGLVFVLTLTSVILLATHWRVWRSWPDDSMVSPGVISGEKPLEAWRTTSAAGTRLIIAPRGYGDVEDSDFTVWDPLSGQKIAELRQVRSSTAVETFAPYALPPPTQTKLYLWSYQPGTGRLERWAGETTPDWRHVIPPEARPKAGFVTSQVQGLDANEGVIFEREPCGMADDACTGIFFPRTQTWYVAARSSLVPSGAQSVSPGAAQIPRRDLMFFAKGVRGWIASSADGRARITLWGSDMKHLLCDFDTESGVALIGVLTSSGVAYVTLYTPSTRHIHTLSTPIQATPAKTAGTVANHCDDSGDDWPSSLVPNSSGAPTIIPVPGVVQIQAMSNGFVLRQDEPDRTVLWPINALTGKFKKPIVAHDVAPRIDGALVWTIAGDGGTGLWLPGQEQYSILPSLHLAPTDNVSLDESLHHLLHISANGTGDLWEIGPTSVSARPVHLLGDHPFTAISFSHDQRAIIGRRPGGHLFGWTLSGTPLGELGVISGDVIWSAYDERCPRMLIWTTEGVISYRSRGIEVPLLHFFPENRCPMPLTATTRNASINSARYNMFSATLSWH